MNSSLKSYVISFHSCIVTFLCFRDIPVDMKYIADPTMHSMPAVTPSPNQKWLACQSMDNKIVIFSALNRFKMNRKKTFSGHMVAGYACGLDFSPDMRYVLIQFK
jgi:pre-mRNA-processing factor 17